VGVLSGEWAYQSARRVSIEKGLREEEMTTKEDTHFMSVGWGELLVYPMYMISGIHP